MGEGEGETMKVTTSTVQKIVITDVPRLDPISVYIEDFGPQRGKITISCWTDSWTNGWGGMGNDYDMRRFFLSCDNDYLIRKFSTGIQRTVNDYHALPKHAKKTVIELRRHGITSDRARELYDLADDLSGCDCLERTGQFEDVLCRIYGDEWYECLPQKLNTKYEYLDRILAAIKEALRS